MYYGARMCEKDLDLTPFFPGDWPDFRKEIFLENVYDLELSESILIEREKEKWGETFYEQVSIYCVGIDGPVQEKQGNWKEISLEAALTKYGAEFLEEVFEKTTTTRFKP